MVILMMVCNLMSCSEVRIPSDTSGSIGCMMRSQPQIVEWLIEHPGNRVDRWKCATADQVAQQ